MAVTILYQTYFLFLKSVTPQTQKARHYTSGLTSSSDETGGIKRGGKNAANISQIKGHFIQMFQLSRRISRHKVSRVGPTSMMVTRIISLIGVKINTCQAETPSEM